MMQRLREAMSTINLAAMGGEGSQVQADETYHGNTSELSRSYRKGLAMYSVRLAPRSSRKADIRKPPLRAMCGRLRVGKSFLHVCSIGRCSHVFGL